MERQRSQAIESLQIYDHHHSSSSSVKCQKCGVAIPIVGKLTKLKSDRIRILEKRIKWLEDYRRGGNSLFKFGNMIIDCVSFMIKST